MTSAAAPAPAPRARLPLFLAIGLVAGLLSGMFGVGGGILIVPALLYLAKLDPKVASGTSLLAIVPVSIVGAATYAVGGHVDLLLAVLLAVGSILGAPVGSWLLKRISRTALRLAFVAFLLVVVVSLFLVVPSRDSVIAFDPLLSVAVVELGFVTGICSGLLGIGGGVIIVPMLVLLFGASDLVAKGSSLLMMIATGASGTVANVRQRTVDVKAALAVGIAAACTTTFGAWIAASLSPRAANIAFAVFLVLIAARMLWDVVRERRRDQRADGAGEESDDGHG